MKMIEILTIIVNCKHIIAHSSAFVNRFLTIIVNFFTEGIKNSRGFYSLPPFFAYCTANFKG